MNSQSASITTDQMNRERMRRTAGDCARFFIRCLGLYFTKCLQRCDYEVPDEEKLKSDPQYGTSMAAVETDAITCDEKFVKRGDIIGLSREGIPIKIMD